MKNLFIFILSLLAITSCATTNEAKLSGKELRNEKRHAEQAVIKKAVDSKRFIIKFDRLYYQHGGIINLRPRANFILVDGEKAVINAAYLGRQYDIRPIEGIKVMGETSQYELKSDSSKGKYEIKMIVNNGSNTFDVYITIGKSGSCSASITNVRLDLVRYSGYIVPIKDKITIPLQNNNIISDNSQSENR